MEFNLAGCEIFLFQILVRLEYYMYLRGAKSRCKGTKKK